MNRFIPVALVFALMVPAIADAHPCRKKARHAKAHVAVTTPPTKPCPPCCECKHAAPAPAQPCTVIVQQLAPPPSPQPTIIRQEVYVQQPVATVDRGPFAFGIAGLASLSDDVGDSEFIELVDCSNDRHKNSRGNGHISRDRQCPYDADDPDFYFTARGWADVYVAYQMRIFGNYDWNTRSDAGDGTVRLGGALDMVGHRSAPTRLSLYGGGQRSVAGSGDWRGFAGGSAEHVLVSRLSALGEVEYDFGDEVVTGRGGLSLRFF